MSLDSATSDILTSALSTVVAIPVTPFSADGSIDWTAYETLLRRTVDAGQTTQPPPGQSAIPVVQS